ncbi:hypothetical protein T459_01663 [Capsicum annuum]|uniref:DUF1985 domain-containing protein n=1 Tax=Capsicum annuum TaxID=4072 RepID=A0A2G3AHQ9_CAPAN|nr:hypothetical protein T459_01663 [Capsicum annuum]
MKRYFPQSTNGINKEALVELFLKENFENKEDVLQMAIIYFIHTFIYSHLNASTVPFSDFKMVEDKKYQFFSWGKVSFSRLMASLRQEFSMEKQLYRLGSIPQVLNVWMFELCSNVDTKVVVREGNNTPRILNWRIVAVRTQFNQFRIRMFSKIDQKFKDLERVMNDRFTKVLKSLQQKNETVKQDVGIEKKSDIVVEEMQPLESIIPGREHDLTLTIYKPPPTTPTEDCGIFVVVYVEYLSEGLSIPCSGINAQYHHLR